MANLGAISKLLRLQKLVYPSGSVGHNASTIAPTLLLCKHNHGKQSIRHGTSKPKISNQSPLVSTSTATIAIGRPYSSSSIGAAADEATSATKATSTLEEFRKREEEREQEFERRQKADEEAKRKSEEEANQAKVDTVRLCILEAAVDHVPTLGFTREAIVQGAEDAGYPSVVHGMFPEGGFALVSHFTGKCNDALIARLQEETDGGQKQVADLLEFLVKAVRMRLEMLAPYKGQWPQAMALIALPQNAPTALAQVLTLVDDICFYSGDRSVDFAWYTRRIGLATILKMTELYMLQDQSPGHTRTWEFLRNRMEEALQLQTVLSQTENVTSTFQRSFNSAFITARNILGLNYDRR